MCKELKMCMEELQENHTGSEIARALAEYAQIVKRVSRDYGDDITVAELRDERPELDFMDDEELEEILQQAKVLHRARAEKHLDREQLKQKKARVLQEIYSMLDTRTEVEKQAILAIAEFEYDWTNRLIACLGNDVLRGLMNHLLEVNRELDEWRPGGGKDVRTTT